VSESDLSKNFCALAKPLVPWRIENLLTSGTPDVYVTGGWVELKWARCWPARETSVLRLPHYTDIQRVRLMERWNANDGAWLVLQVKTMWFCFEAPAAQRVGHLTKLQLQETATHFSFVKPTSDQLCSWLRR